MTFFNLADNNSKLISRLLIELSKEKKTKAILVIGHGGL
jgi:hypothetical protein